MGETILAPRPRTILYIIGISQFHLHLQPAVEIFTVAETSVKSLSTLMSMEACLSFKLHRAPIFP